MSITGKQKTVVQFILSIREGGAESLVRDYALLMREIGINVVIVTVYCSDENSSNYKQLKENGVKIYTLKSKHRLFNLMTLKKIWLKLFSHNQYTNKLLTLYSKKLYKICQKENASCIHAHLSVLKYISPLSSELTGCKLIYTCHSLPSRYFNNTDMKAELLAAQQLISDNNLLIVALHNEMKDELCKILSTNNVTIVPNGTDFSKYKNIRESKEQIRESLSIPSDAFIVGHVGRFSPMKNHQFLLKVFQDIKKLNPHSHLLLVGDGPTLGDVEQSIADTKINNEVTILSHRSDVARLMKAMDVFVFPSFFEGLPVTMVEAQLSSLRVIMSDTITKDCVFSKDVVRLSLENTPTEWARAALDQNLKGDIENDIRPFDMKNVIKQLEQLYFGNDN